jgi:hypothetical protein
MSTAVAPDDFLSGKSGHVAGIRATSRALAVDLAADLRSWPRRRRLRAAAAGAPRRRVLAIGIERPEPNLLEATRQELVSSHHEVEFAGTTIGDRGKFENLNALLAAHPPAGHDWLLAVDDDIALPPGFLDTFIFLAERFGFRLAQPAHRARSHAAWDVTRRRATTVARETRYVEIGPLTAFHSSTFERLLPFPELRIGWGLDLHWSALAAARGWPIGVIDATPIRHGLRPVASGYDSRAAIEEARGFLAEHPYTTAIEAGRTVAEHRTW